MDKKTSSIEKGKEKGDTPVEASNHSLVDAPIPAPAENQTPDTVPDSSKKDEAVVAIGNVQLCLLIASLFCGTFVMALDATIIGTAVPVITAQFNSLDEIAWYGSGYLITITAFQPTFGKLYQFVSARILFMACVVVFEVGSILCAAASSSAVFIIGRAIAGAGAAGLFQGSLVIITQTVRLEKRPLCISIVTSTYAVAVCIGPVIGGVFTDKVSWRWCFWINVPIGLVVLVLTFLLFHPPKRSQTPRSAEFDSLTLAKKVKRLDPLGSLFIISAVVCILLALQWGGQTKAWSSPTVVGLLVAFPLLVAMFAWTQWRLGSEATLPLWLLKQRSMLGGAAYSFLISMPTYLYGYYLPIYFQVVKGSSATESGYRFLALAVPQIFAVILSGGLVTAFGFYVPFLVIGTAVGLIGSGLFLMLGLDSPTAHWATFLVICGVGTGMAINLPYTIVQAVLKEDVVPIGNAAFQFMFQLGASLSLSIGQTIFLGRLKTSAQLHTPSIPMGDLISSGASHIARLAGGSEEFYNSLRQAYMDALHDTYMFPVVVTGVALITTIVVENKNIKKVAKQRESQAQESSLKAE